MKIYWSFLLLFVVCCGAQEAPDAQNEEKPTPPSISTTTAGIITIKPGPVTSTSKPNTTTTTTAKTTTSATPPSTTTTKSTTTTTSTTTKPTTTTSTTQTPPTTTSTAKPTPSPTPTPKPTPPKLEVNHWSLNITGTNRTCLVMNAAVQIELAGKNGTNATEQINVPANTTATGQCNKTSALLIASWSGKAKEQYHLIVGLLHANDSKYSIATMAVWMRANQNDTNGTTIIHNHPEFSVSDGHSYKCDKEQTLNLTDAANKTVGWIHVRNLQFEAFVNRTDRNFEAAWDCEGSINSDVVPIVVGCVLMVLILVILAAYIIGRRRWNARGYLSIP